MEMNMIKRHCGIEFSRPSGTDRVGEPGPGAKARGYSPSSCRAGVWRYVALVGLVIGGLSGYAEEVFVRASQIGYRPEDVKIGVAFGKGSVPTSFAVVAADGGSAVFQGTAKPVVGVRWGQFENHVELDFSALKTSGRYALRVGDVKSLPFTIDTGAYAELPGQLLDFMRQQRCGYNPWLDAVCHPFDGRTAYGPLTNGTYMDARGGWHDAADLLKYLLTSGNATAQMLLAYSLGKRSPKSEVRSPKFRGRTRRLLL